MPQMNGRRLAAEMKRTRPEIRTLFISGYTENVIVHLGVLDGGTSLLQKPFRPNHLFREVSRWVHGYFAKEREIPR